MNLLSVIAASRRRADPATAAFAAASGATDLAGIDALVKYVKGQSLWDNFRCYPMKSAQNAGSGSTVFGFGGLTANNGTLINSPTWGAGGLATNGTNQYVDFDDIISGGHLCTFSRVTPSSATPAVTSMILAQDNSGVGRGWYSAILTNGRFRLLRSGNGSQIEAYDTDILATTSDQTLVSQWIEGAGRSFWQNKTNRALTLLSGTTNQSSLINSSQKVTAGANFANGNPNTLFEGTHSCHAVINGANITTTQRETITDLINAL
jgi:hypothetical protein